MNYLEKYIKYKTKYLNLIDQLGSAKKKKKDRIVGEVEVDSDLDTSAFIKANPQKIKKGKSIKDALDSLNSRLKNKHVTFEDIRDLTDEQEILLLPDENELLPAYIYANEHKTKKIFNPKIFRRLIPDDLELKKQFFSYKYTSSKKKYTNILTYFITIANHMAYRIAYIYLKDLLEIDSETDLDSDSTFEFDINRKLIDQIARAKGQSLVDSGKESIGRELYEQVYISLQPENEKLFTMHQLDYEEDSYEEDSSKEDDEDDDDDDDKLDVSLIKDGTGEFNKFNKDLIIGVDRIANMMKKNTIFDVIFIQDIMIQDGEFMELISKNFSKNKYKSIKSYKAKNESKNHELQLGLVFGKVDKSSKASLAHLSDSDE